MIDVNKNKNSQNISYYGWATGEGEKLRWWIYLYNIPKVVKFISIRNIHCKFKGAQREIRLKVFN